MISCYIEEPFHMLFLASTTSLSLFSNGLLLFIIFKTSSSSSIGSYRYLLGVFAISDILTSITHAALQPIMHMTSTGAYFFPRHGPIMMGGHSYDTVFCLVFVATYYQTFLILAYHYVYRYKTVTSGIYRCFTDSSSSSVWITISVVVNIMYIASLLGACAISYLPTNETRALVPSEILDIYGIDLRDLSRGYAVVAIQQPDPISGEMLYHTPTVIGLLLLVLIFGSTKCYCLLYLSNNFRDKIRKTSDSQNKTATDENVSSFAHSGISLGTFGNFLYAITIIFPSVDSFFVLFFIGRFRAEVTRMFRISHISSAVSSIELRSNARN